MEEEVIRKHNYSKDIKIYQKTFDELIKDSKLATSFNKLPKKKSALQTSTQARTVMEEQYGFTITNTPARVMQVGKITSYTFHIERENNNPSFFENLVIQNDSIGNTTAHIIKYTPFMPMTAFAEHNSYSFEGETEFTSIIYDDTQLNTTGKMVTDCRNLYGFRCTGSYSTSNGSSCTASPHIPMGYCTDLTPDCIKYTFISQSCTTYDDGTGDPTGGFNPGGGSSYGTGGGGGTDPVYSDPVPDNNYIAAVEDPCEKLKKLTKVTQANPTNPIREALKQNQSDAENENFEKGYKLTYSLATDSFNVAEAPSINANCSQIDFVLQANLIGIFHSHPISCGLSEMFSHKDIILFYKIIKDYNFGNTTYSNGTPIDYSNFVITVATGFGTYAIKLKDWDVFKTKMENILLNKFSIDDYLEKFESIQKKGQFDNLGNDISTAGKSEKNMLEMINSIFGSGISLYKADPNFTTWNKLENINNIITPIPCN